MSTCPQCTQPISEGERHVCQWGCPRCGATQFGLVYEPNALCEQCDDKAMSDPTVTPEPQCPSAEKLIGFLETEAAYCERLDCFMRDGKKVDLAEMAANFRDAATLLRTSPLEAVAEKLAEACEAALEHTRELRDTWMRGAIRELDSIGMGGTRSNRNVDVESKLYAAITDYRKEFNRGDIARPTS